MKEEKKIVFEKKDVKRYEIEYKNGITIKYKEGENNKQIGYKN